MSELFGDRLVEAIERKAAPICVGIDPIFEMLPDAVAGGDPSSPQRQRSRGGDRRDLRVHHPRAQGRRAARAVREVPVGVLREIPLGRRRGVLQPDPGGQRAGPARDRRRQARRHRQHRQRLRRRPSGRARTSGTIGRRGHARRDHRQPDARPRHARAVRQDRAKDAGKGLFVLVRTSNPGSAELQDVKLADGRTWSEMLADKLAPVAAQRGPGRHERLELARRGRRRDPAAHDAEPPPAPAAIRSSSCPATARRARRPT